MAYVSELLGKPVVGPNGERIGRLDDIIASVGGGIAHPRLTAIVVKRRGGLDLVAIADVVVLIPPAIPLTKVAADLVPYEPGHGDMYLARDVLDRQIIDTNGVRVVRVNDLEIVRVNGDFYVTNVDIGSLGLLRRLGLARLAERFAGRLRKASPPGTISWDGVELLPDEPYMHLKVPGEKIAELHPADLAEIISDLSRIESGKLLDSLDVKTLADTLEEVEPDFQASLVEAMPDEKVADVLEEMSPDEAADLLHELPEDRSAELLKLMETEDAEDVKRLLAYPVDRAGGIMTTEYFAIPPDLTAAQALALLRETAAEAETIFYVYVTDADDRLVGVFSLRELVVSPPKCLVSEFMQSRVVSVNVLEPQDEVGHVVSKYNLLAVPVVDDDGRLVGIVTADDALDKIIPTAWKKQLPRMYR